MKRRHLVAVPVLVAVTLVIIHYWPKPAEPVAQPGKAGLSIAERAARSEAANRLAKMAPPAPHSSVGKFSAEAIQAAEEAFRSMITVRGLVIQDQERSALAQQILATPDGSALMREILLDPAFARSAFGDFQAEARFYAIVVLKEAARQGNLDLVVDTAAALANQLAEVASEPDRGRSEDLMSIAAIVGEKVGSQGLQDGNSPMLGKLGFTRDLSKPVRILYLRGLFQGVWAADGFEEAQTVVDRLKTL